MQDKQQAYLAEIIEKVNGLFEGKLTDGDQLVYVNGVLKGKPGAGIRARQKRPQGHSSWAGAAL